MILGRLRVRGKLNVLLLLPLTAVTLIAVPFVAGQVDNARAASTTADAAGNARQLGALVWELQRERLLTAVYLASPSGDRIGLMEQQRKVADTAAAVGDSLGPDASEELVEALARLESLTELRTNALARGTSLESVARTYHAVIEAVIDALRLVPQRTSDAEGTRQLTALDALLRANEYSSLRGMAVVAVADDPDSGIRLLENSTAQAQMLTERFVQQGDVEQSRLVVLVDQGEAARRVADLATTAPDPRPRTDVEAFVADTLAGVESQSTLRRLVQDRVTREISGAAAARADAARSAAWTVGLGAALLFVLVVVLAVSVSRSIANPLQRLTRAAGRVADLANAELERVSDDEQADERADEQRTPRLAAIDVTSGDEVGELATAFNRVQATAALLVERQMVTRRNVSMMFANVAQRTQSLVSRQLALVDELERNEQDAQLLARLYRLDHLSTRLGRNAKNLLVVAGARDEIRLGAPSPLATALRAALAEIEDYKRVRVGWIGPVMVSSELVSDLILVFAELLENATAFSPPGATVDVQSELGADGGCQISVVDHGIGMKQDHLDEENRRLVERERLDIAPTSVLGLFVVGRLARRHGLDVHLAHTPGGGVTATVGIPAELVAPSATPPAGATPPAATSPAGPPAMTTPAMTSPAATPAVATPAVATPAVAIPSVATPAVATPAVATPAAATPVAATPAPPMRVQLAPVQAASERAAPVHPAAAPPVHASHPETAAQPVPHPLPAWASFFTPLPSNDGFSWFSRPGKPSALPAGGPAPAAPAAPAPAAPAPAAPTPAPPPPAPPAPPARPAPAAQAAPASPAPAATAAPAMGRAPGPAAGTYRVSRSLPKRVPGANIAPSLRRQNSRQAAAPVSAAPPPAAQPIRDPESDRAAFDGFAQAMTAAPKTRPGQTHDQVPTEEKRA